MLIDANCFNELLDKRFDAELDGTMLKTEAKLMRMIADAPTINPVKHGEWIYKERHRKYYRQYTGIDTNGETHTITVEEESVGKEPYCSECGAQAAESFLTYCPKCGAYMLDEVCEDE